MRYPLYVCATCSQGFTRKSSANRHNLNIHSRKGHIVRFLDYIVGRIDGLYATADPLSFRKNRGNNLRNLRPIKPDSLHPSLKNSDTDSIAAAEVHDLSSNNRPFVQERNNNHDFSSPDNLIGLAIRALEIEALYARVQWSADFKELFFLTVPMVFEFNPSSRSNSGISTFLDM